MPTTPMRDPFKKWTREQFLEQAALANARAAANPSWAALHYTNAANWKRRADAIGLKDRAGSAFTTEGKSDA